MILRLNKDMLNKEIDYTVMMRHHKGLLTRFKIQLKYIMVQRHIPEKDISISSQIRLYVFPHV